MSMTVARTLRRCILLLLGLVAGASVAARSLEAQARASDPRTAKLKEYLGAAARLGQLNGSVLIAEDGKVLIDTAYGWANIELGVRNTPETRFRVASVTKQFTAAALMLLAKDGKLSLADPISRWVDSVPAAWSGLTIHQLIRHTSGISDYEEWFDGYTTQAYSDYMAPANAAARIVRDAKAKPLDHEPGTKFRYSNSAYIILGFIIERASGMSYDEFLQARIHRPLGMTASGQDQSDPITMRRAQGYAYAPGAYPRKYFNGLAPADFRNAVYLRMQPPQADGGLLTTARDLYKWDQALYANTVLDRAQTDSMFKPGIGNYGYGWFINTGRDGVTHEHSGGYPGFAAYFMRVPQSKRTIIVLNNTERSGRTVRDVAGIMRGDTVPVPRARQLTDHDVARDSARVGMYRTATGDSIRIFLEDGNFGAHWPQNFRAGLLAEGRDAYFISLTGGTARFTETGGTATVSVTDARGRPLITATRRP